MQTVKQVFTFGLGQKHDGGYHVIHAESKAKCRELMFEKFGPKWSFQYNSEEEAGVAEFGLREIK